MSRRGHLLPAVTMPQAQVVVETQTLGQAMDAGEFAGRTFEVRAPGGNTIVGVGVYSEGVMSFIDPTDGYGWLRSEVLRDLVIVRRLNATITYEEVTP